MRRSFYIILLLLSLMLTGCFLTSQSEKPVGATSSALSKPDSVLKHSSEASREEDLWSDNDAQKTTPIDDGNVTVEDYFPILSDLHMQVVYNDNPLAIGDIYVDYTDSNKLQLREVHRGGQTVYVLAVENHCIILNQVHESVHERENYLGKKATDGTILLKDPIVEGTSWVNDDGSLSSITGIDVQVITDHNTYETVEVTKEAKDTRTTYYFSKNMGLIRVTNEVHGITTSRTLHQVATNAPYKQKINFYYPLVDSNEIGVIQRTVAFYTNDITRNTLSEIYKDIPKGCLPVFSKESQINSLYLNEDGRVYADLNEGFSHSLNLDVKDESRLLQSLANTFGDYYQVEKLILTIDNQLYNSEHIKLEQNESLVARYHAVTPID